MKIMKKYLFAILISVFLSNFLFAQNTANADYRAIKTEKGMAIFYRNQSQDFSFLVDGKNPTGRENNNGSLTIETDNHGVEIEFIKTSLFLGKKKLVESDEILKAHRAWHIETRETKWKVKLNLISDSFTLVNVYSLMDSVLPNRTIPTVYYGYSVEGVPKRAFFQTVLMGDVVLSIGTTFPETVNVDEVRASIKRIIESITLLPPQKIAPKKKVTKKIKKN